MTQPWLALVDTTTMERSRSEPPSHLDLIARNVVDAAVEVHRHLGPGFLEAAYERALHIELVGRGLSISTQRAIPIVYKDELVATARIDLVVENELVVELKAIEAIHPVHVRQLLSYLRAGGFQLGLVLNFNVPLMRDGIRRVVNSIHGDAR